MAEQKVDFTISAQDRATAVFRAVSGELGKLKGSYEALVKFGTAGVIGAVAGFVSKEIVDRTVDAERASARLAATLKATGFAAGLTKTQLEDLSDAVKESSAFDDDEIKKGLTALLRFREVQGDVFQQAARLAPDLASALDIGLVEAYTRLGRALQDPATGMRGLREAGVKLDDQQVKLAKSLQEAGDNAGAQKIVLDALSQTVKGLREAENSGIVGDTRRLAIAYDDLLKAIGRSAGVGQGSSVIKFITEDITDLRNIIESGSWLERLDNLLRSIGSTGSTRRSLSRGVADAAFGAFEVPGAQAGADQASSEQQGKRARESFLRSLNVFQGPINKLGADAEKDLADKRLQVLEQFHGEGLVSEASYYDQRRALITEKSNAELAFLQSEIQRVSDVLANDPGLSAEDRARKEVEDFQLVQARSKAQRDAAQEFILLAGQERQAGQQLEDQLAEVNARIADIQGDAVTAGNIRFNIANRPLLRRFSEGSPERAKVEQLRDLTIANDQYRRATEAADRIQQQLQNREQEIEASRRTGAISDLESMQRIGAARLQSVSQLQGIKEQLDAIAASSDDPRLQAGVATFNARLIELASTADLVGERFRTVMVDPITDFLDGLGDRTKKASDLFRDLIHNIGHEIAHLGNQAIAQNTASVITKGVGGLLPGLLFGQKAKSGAGATVGGSDFFGDIPFLGPYATGTDFVPETGLAIVHRGERITPAGENWGGGNVSINIDARGSTVDAVAALRAWVSSGELERRALAAVSNSRRRGGAA